MQFPKQSAKGYPRNPGQVPTEKLEGLCRTLFVAALLLMMLVSDTKRNIEMAQERCTEYGIDYHEARAWAIQYAKEH